MTTREITSMEQREMGQGLAMAEAGVPFSMSTERGREEEEEEAAEGVETCMVEAGRSGGSEETQQEDVSPCRGLSAQNRGESRRTGNDEASTQGEGRTRWAR